MARIIESRKGKRMLSHQGYIYHFHSESKNGSRFYWRCSDRDGCTARVTSNADIDRVVTIYKQSNHSHQPNFSEEQVRTAVTRIKRRAAAHPNEPPQSVVIEELAPVQNEEVIVLMPERMALVRMVNRAQNSARPELPTSLVDCVILPPYDITLNNLQFLQFDSGQDDPDRLLIFYTEADLRNLAQSPTVFGDGTFKTVPNMFGQMYTLHGIVMGKVFPMIYCLCVRKNEDTYNRIFNELNAKAQQLGVLLQPTTIIFDFEKGAMNAAIAAFPQINVKGCLFHFTQAIWRHIVSSGLKGAYNDPDDSTIRDDARMLMSIPFIPLVDVIDIFVLLKDEIDDRLYDIWTYMDRTYVRGTPARQGRQGRVVGRGRRPPAPPRFPPEIWNVYDSVINGVQRTTNVVEGWHSKFQRLIVTHHSAIWRFLETIKKEQNNNAQLITQLRGGHRNIKYPIKNAYFRNQRQLEELVRNYDTYVDEDNVNTYLRAVSYRLKIHQEAIDDDESSESD